MENPNQPTGSLDQGIIGPEINQQAIDKAKKKIAGGRVAAFVIAAIAILVGIWFMSAAEGLEDMGFDSEIIPTIGIAALVLGGVFLLLGIWSMSQPYPALLIAMIIYGLNAVFSLINVGKSGSSGIFSLVLVAVLLGLIIRGWLGANELRKLKQGGR